jgi:hypothetical protein
VFVGGRFEAILGDNTPQENYTMSAKPIGEELVVHAGIGLGNGVEFRYEYSPWVLNDKSPGLVGVGPHGPYSAFVVSSPAYNFEWR